MLSPGTPAPLLTSLYTSSLGGVLGYGISTASSIFLPISLVQKVFQLHLSSTTQNFASMPAFEASQKLKA